MDRDSLKKAVGLAAIKFIQADSIIGIGTGSTVDHFINALDFIKYKIKGVVSSSEQTTNKLKKFGIKILNLNEVKILPIYIDSADEIDHQMCMIKGGGAALTKEKIIASAAKQFICIADISKRVNILGKFPLPIEIIDISRSLVTEEIERIGGTVRYRKGVITENGNIILDVYNLSIKQPEVLEQHINSIPGVVTVGLFAARKADLLLISNPSSGIETITR
ncbi:ribose-5-phosphate isomerase RpiA [Pantoea sp. SoEX]|uniref:ribose-5-phosphate isomerase RpiA n=1 Tax=Pantoea sp. SoEX TaxID=2576763 RepID=UPI0013581053|nr:ribose-5-phosphate isomerase RpiA [Pantoea sp. SoEX]MXP51204.1 ribose-5-phosphate isomerase RpiA [Pantoea sp. SoEX]